MAETPKTQSKAPEETMKPTVIEIIAQEEQQDVKLTRASIAVAIVLHLFIFWFNWPTFAGGLKDATEKKTKIYVVKQVKFQQPPKQELQQIPKPKSKKVPIPDPTPDEPEPIRDDEPDEDIDFIPDDNLVLGIPDAPKSVTLRDNFASREVCVY